MSEPDVETWHLVAQWRDARGARLDSVRTLTAEEASQASDDSALVHRLIEGLGWAEVGTAWEMLAPLLDSVAGGGAADARPASVSEADARLRSLWAALRHFADRICAVPELLETEAAALAEHETIITRSGWNVIAARLGTSELGGSDRLLDTKDGIEVAPGRKTTAVVLTSTCARLLGLPDSEDRAYLAGPILARLVGAGELMYASALKTTAILHRPACLRLRRLTTDVLYGEPVLVRGFEKIGSGGEAKLQMTRLPIDLIGRLGVATKNSEALLESAQQTASASATSQSEGERVASEGEPSDAGGQSATEANGSTPRPDRSPPAGEGSAPPPIDMVGLVAELRSLNDRLERLWSESLAHALSSGDIESEVHRWHALLTAVYNEVEARASREAAVGRVRTIARWPVPVSDAARLTLNPPPEAALAQEEVALLYAIRDLAEATRAFSEPSAFELNVKSGAVKRWWEAGAFALARDAAELTLRSSESLAAAEAVVVASREPAGDGEGHPVPASRAPGFVWVAAGRRALACGLPEAALLYFQLAANARPFGGETPSGEGPDVGHALGEVHQIVSNVLDRLSTGEVVPLGVVLPLAHATFQQLTQFRGAGAHLAAG